MLHFLSPNRLRTCENSETPIPPQPKAAMRSIGPALRSPAGLLFARARVGCLLRRPRRAKPSTAPSGGRRACTRRRPRCRSSGNCPAALHRPASPRCARACRASWSSARSSKAATSTPATCFTSSTPRRSKSNSTPPRPRSPRRAVLDQETQNAKRVEALSPRGAVSQSQHEIAIANLGQADADVAARKADVARAKLNLDTPDPRADQRAHRPRARHRRRAGRTGRRPRISRRSSSSTRLCRLHAVGRPNSTNCAASSKAATSKRPRTAQGAADSRRRRDLSARRQAAVLRHHGRSHHRPGHAARRVPQSEVSCCPACMSACRSSRASIPTRSPCRSRRSAATTPARAKCSWCATTIAPAVAPVRLGRAVDDHWLILDGVKPGDRVVVDGFQKFVAGDVVDPEPLAAMATASSGGDDVSA